MQQPTCKNIRIRKTEDAHKIFRAIQQGKLRMVTRRLDADERIALTTGCVYAWEERGPHTEITGLGIERFTEGRRWSPSRVRDEFLFYYEKYTPSAETGQPSILASKLPAPKDWDPLVKQTYSVWVETEKGRRKWHLTAYFTQTTVDHLGTIDDLEDVRSCDVPAGIFTSTRITKSRTKGGDDQSNRSTESPGQNSAPSRTFAAFPPPYHSQQQEQEQEQQPDAEPGAIQMYHPYANQEYPGYYSNSSGSPQQFPESPVPSPHSPVVPSSRPYPTQYSQHRTTVGYHFHHHSRPPSVPSPRPEDSVHNGPPMHPQVTYVQGNPYPNPMDSRQQPMVYSHNIRSARPSPVSSSPVSSAWYNSSINPTQPQSHSPMYPTRSESHRSHHSAAYPSSYDYTQYSSPAAGPSEPPYPIIPDVLPVPSLNENSMLQLHGDIRHQHPHLPPLSIPETVEQPVMYADDPLAPSGICFDIRRGDIRPSRALAPLQALKRSHPYRRDPTDDRALRLLDPKPGAPGP